MLCIQLVSVHVMFPLLQSSRLQTHLLVAPLSQMYHQQYGWWYGVELGRRVLVVLFIVAFPANNVGCVWYKF